jgi:hypothetical protein
MEVKGGVKGGVKGSSHCVDTATGGRAETATAPSFEMAQSSAPPNAPDGTAVGTVASRSTVEASSAA